MINFKPFLLCLSMLLWTFIQASNFKAVAYIPAYRMSNLSDINYDMITHVMAAFANPDETGTLSFSGDITTFVSTVHNNGAKAIVSIGGGGDYSWGNKVSIYEDLFKTQQSRTAFIHKIMNYIRTYNLDGLDNDIEGNALALSNFNVFTQELGDSLHAANLEYSAAIGVGGSWGVNYWDDNSLSKLDFIMTMSYGGVGNWNWNTKNDDHTYAKMKSDMEYFTITKNMNPEKIVGGIPFYAVEFPSSAQQNYNDYHKTICSIYNDPQFDAQNPFHSDTLTTTGGNTVYINSIETIQRKIDYCDEFGGGIMIWEIGQDCYDGSVSLQDSMYAYISANKVGIVSLPKISFTVQPNPTKHSVYLESPFNQTTKYFITNTLGELVKQGEFRNSSTILLDSLQNGVYFIQLEDGKHQFNSAKLIKK